MERDGTVTYSSMDYQEIDSFKEGHELISIRKLQNNCWAKNLKHAVKITNDLRGQLIAMNQWEVE